jgi:hypothetical protein
MGVNGSSWRAEIEVPSATWALAGNRLHLARSLLRNGVNVSPLLWIEAPCEGEVRLAKARALANGGLPVNFTSQLTWEAICGAGNDAAAVTELVLDWGADPNLEVSGFPLLAWVLFAEQFLHKSTGCQRWREVADVIVKAGGSLQLGAGQRFENHTWVFVTVAVVDQRCGPLKYALNLPAKALYGIDVPAEELEPLLQRLRELAGQVATGAGRTGPVRCLPASPA